jgi:hypothetical protein
MAGATPPRVIAVPTRPSRPDAAADAPDAVEAPSSVTRNFALSADQAEWLRVQAFMLRTSQAQLVREAIDDLMKKHAAAR